MSKRFGRNQKRKLKQEISTLSLKLVSENTRNSLLRRQIDEQTEALKLVASMLGEHFVAFVPSTMQIQSPYRDTMIPAPSSRRPTTFMQARDYPQSVANSIMQLKHSRFSGYLDKLRDCVHFRYVTPGGECGYSCSREVWAFMPSDVRHEIVIREISREMAEFLAKNPEMLER
jgi:hypothetical protein